MTWRGKREIKDADDKEEERRERIRNKNLKRNHGGGMSLKLQTRDTSQQPIHDTDHQFARYSCLSHSSLVRYNVTLSYHSHFFIPPGLWLPWYCYASGGGSPFDGDFRIAEPSRSPPPCIDHDPQVPFANVRSGNEPSQACES